MQFKINSKPVEYSAALTEMEKRVNDVIAGKEEELVWLLEHEPVYTAGTSAKSSDLLNPQFPVFEAGRGGEYTYHGPGQRIAYVVIDLKKRERADIKKYVHDLEEVIIKTLAHFGIKGERRKGRVGIWVVSGKSENKIAAIGIRIKKWVTYHGLSVNIEPDLSHFAGIVPCGIKEYGVTSFAELGKKVTMKQFDEILKEKFSEVF